MATLDFGEPPKKIPGIHTKTPNIFPLTEAKTKNASHAVPIEDSQWQAVHSKIQGEFYDKDFPPEVKSLSGDKLIKGEDSKAKIEKMEKYTFKRISHLLKTLDVIKDGISPTDIYQGALGDCFFLTSLSSIAEYPDRLMRNLNQRKQSIKGAYSVNLCITGQWMQVVVDDIFPVNEKGTLSFCFTKDQEIWAMLLEKAYAKVYGGFYNMGSGGLTANAMKDLTSAPG